MSTSIGDSRVGVVVVVAFGNRAELGLELRLGILDVELGLAALVVAEFEDNDMASSIGGCECNGDSIELTSSLHLSWPFNNNLGLRSRGGIIVSGRSREGDLVGGAETEIRRWSCGSERAVTVTVVVMAMGEVVTDVGGFVVVVVLGLTGPVGGDGGKMRLPTGLATRVCAKLLLLLLL